MQQTETLIIGASIAGLATAASLQKRNINYIIIEKEAGVAAPWRRHYQRLHLHTNKRISNLPYKKFESAVPRYPSRQQVVDYLEAYRQTANIQPFFNTVAKSIRREGKKWITETNNGSFMSTYLVMATGAFSSPKPVQFSGMESFPGPVLHSSRYQTGKDFSDQKVLVVGFGNSACEIAIDLYENGAQPAMAVRSPVNIIPRDILGIPILEISLLLSRLPTAIADAVTEPLLRLIFGDITQLGLQKLPYGPFRQIEKDGHVPVLDIGTVRHIRQGHIQVRPGIKKIEGSTVHFTDGLAEDFDAMIAAIGYDSNLSTLLQVEAARFEDLRYSTSKQSLFGKDGIYFCGFWISPTGQIREIGLDAQRIAKHIAGQQ